MSYSPRKGLIGALLNHVLMVSASPGDRLHWSRWSAQPHHPFAPAPGAGATRYHLHTATLGIPNKAFFGAHRDL